MGSNGSYGGGEPEMMPPLDLSAHIVTPTVPKDTPILRVLFHAGQTAFGLPITPQNPSRGTRQQVRFISNLEFFIARLTTLCIDLHRVFSSLDSLGKILKILGKMHDGRVSKMHLKFTHTQVSYASLPRQNP